MRRRLHDGMMLGKAARVEKLGYWDLGQILVANQSSFLPRGGGGSPRPSLNIPSL